MVKVIFIAVYNIAYLLSYCSIYNPELQVVAKWSFIASDFYECDDCEVNKPSCCVFFYKGRRYIRERSYKLDSIGGIDSIYSYGVPLGVNIWGVEEMRSLMDIDTVEYNALKEIRIRYDMLTNSIMENEKRILNTIFEEKENWIVKSNGELLTIYELKSQ